MRAGGHRARSEATRASRTERAGEAARERASRGVRRGEAPRASMDQDTGMQALRSVDSIAEFIRKRRESAAS